MQKQEISNIMIFFVIQDLEGQPPTTGDAPDAGERSIDDESTIHRIPPAAKGNVQAVPCPKPLAGSLSVPLPVSGRSKLTGYPAL